MSHYTPCVEHIVYLALCAFIRCLRVIGLQTSWEADDHDHQSGANVNIDIVESQNLRNEGNTRINKLSAIRPGMEKIVEKVRILINLNYLKLTYL